MSPAARRHASTRPTCGPGADAHPRNNLGLVVSFVIAASVVAPARRLTATACATSVGGLGSACASFLFATHREQSVIAGAAWLPWMLARLTSCARAGFTPWRMPRRGGRSGACGRVSGPANLLLTCWSWELRRGIGLSSAKPDRPCARFVPCWSCNRPGVSAVKLLDAIRRQARSATTCPTPEPGTFCSPVRQSRC